MGVPNFISIYAVYDYGDNEIPVVVGTLKECCDFLGVSPGGISHAIKRESLINCRYKIYFIGREQVSEKQCARCGKIKPINEFHKRTKKGKEFRTNLCEECHKIHESERRRERKLRDRK